MPVMQQQSMTRTEPEAVPDRLRSISSSTLKDLDAKSDRSMPESAKRRRRDWLQRKMEQFGVLEDALPRKQDVLQRTRSEQKLAGLCLSESSSWSCLADALPEADELQIADAVELPADAAGPLSPRADRSPPAAQQSFGFLSWLFGQRRQDPAVASRSGAEATWTTSGIHPRLLAMKEKVGAQYEGHLRGTVMLSGLFEESSSAITHAMQMAIQEVVSPIAGADHVLVVWRPCEPPVPSGSATVTVDYNTPVKLMFEALFVEPFESLLAVEALRAEAAVGGARWILPSLAIALSEAGRLALRMEVEAVYDVVEGLYRQTL
eukprot:TRINITY_DN10376_c0_g1_i1.p1 TRINITY_DN10376_c0_g1~~TRINITY_DN10376_c0_g1_i1.p1  ORF type:complete len:320 (+),score=57.70 TRINITY_DN10376_c0_g1_i1:87-1046(+)